MRFFEKNEENLEALCFSLTEREKTTFAIGIYDCDDTFEKAIDYITQQFPSQPTLVFDLFGKKIDSLLAFFRENLPQRKGESLPIVHLTRIDPLLFASQDHKVVSSALVAQLNMERELLFHEVEALVVIWLTKEGYNRLRMNAPDFMDWVVASFVFEHDDNTPFQKPSVEIPQETIDDRSKAAIAQLKEKAEILQQRTVKFEQNKKLNPRDYKEYFNLLLTLATAYIDFHDLTHAQHTLEKAHQLAKNYNLANGFEFGKLLVNWGDVETSLGKLSQALILFEEALSHFLLLEDKPNIAISYEKLGQTHSSLGNLDKALTFFQDETKLFEELYHAYPNNVSFKNGLAISYSKLGDTHSALGNLDNALTFFQDQTKLFEELYHAYPNNVSFKNSLAISYYKLGEFSHDKLKDAPKAKGYFQQAEALWQALVQDAPQYIKFQQFYKQVQRDLEGL